MYFKPAEFENQLTSIKKKIIASFDSNFFHFIDLKTEINVLSTKWKILKQKNGYNQIFWIRWAV